LLLVGLAVGMWTGGQDASDGSAADAVVVDANATTTAPNVLDPYAVNTPADATEEPTNLAEPLVEPVAKTQANDGPATAVFPALPGDEPESVSDRPKSASETAVAAPAPSDEGEPTAAPPASDPRQPHVLKFDPLDFDPTRLSLAGGAASAAEPSAGSIEDDPAGGAGPDAARAAGAAAE